ncbi:MAG: MerR family transcriptional regulator [Furfurilactobacillus sp.]|uniref:MerR family transcriptional regulator n=2 Tax=Furfurilactobacillus TaxID=2767882 RepID=A0ABT6DF32_9LACO|nr:MULTISPECIES: MerR family transcriptional regulator [Furfurilactobacillus]QLE65430.1 MerR transcriptional regulator [Furfurilactobacillus rossiae]MCF6160928.1 MerR family transcriptional regulator [Furfurilactobacillus milii]MCH4011938.1 MerR family transcriptional regulator [Furfurilactobacillus sp.]MCH4037830.1 MerR family transcriptional regulator [Furfurilactobacillus sp.]MCH4115533.1 MerR family transcriptional regulator [Furfurilactobacillus sp.]
MAYSIGTIAKKTGLSIYTLRYYDKEGLTPFVKRNEASGRREFTDSDLNFLSVITCLKGTGMQLDEIRDFVNWCMEGDGTLDERLTLFEEQKQVVIDQIGDALKNLQKINHKINYYQKAVAAGTEDAVTGVNELPETYTPFNELVEQLRDGGAEERLNQKIN